MKFDREKVENLLKEIWIENYIFFSGQKWSDPPPTRQQAEEEWAARQKAKDSACNP